LYFKRELKKDFLTKYKLFKLEIKTYFTALYETKWYEFDIKAYFDKRVFSNFETRWSCFLGLIKILLFIHLVLMLIDIIFV